MGSRTASAFPEQAVLHHRAGTMALNGKLYDHANTSFRKALSLNPMVWEAFEGLCTLGEWIIMPAPLHMS
jgi:anaphase-promoting complex subunit 3